MDIQTVICPLLHNLSEQTNYGQIVQIDCFRFVVKQAVCSDGYTTKHLVRDTLRPDKTADNLPYEKVGNNKPVCIADEVPFDIPDSWEWVRISGVFSVVNGDRGKNYPAKSTLSNTGIPFISAVNLDGKTVIEDNNLLCLSDEQFNKLGSGKLEKDDVVVCIRGSLGKHGRYPFEKGAIASSLVILRPHLNIPLLSDFIMMYLDSPLFFSEIKRYDNGTAQPNLAAKSLEMFFLPLPPLPEQKRIVEKLNEVSSLTDNYAEAYVRVAELNQKFPELLKKSISQEAVQGKLVSQDPSDEPASVLLERIRAEKQKLVAEGKIKKDKNESVIFRRDNSHYEKRGSEEVCIDDEIPFEIPDTWEWCRLGNILTKLTDGTHSTPKYTNTGIPFISVKDISSGKLNFNDCKYISIDEHQELYSRCNPELNDILLTKVGTTGIPVIVDTEKQFSLFVSVALLKFNNELIFNKYVVQLINSPLVQKQVIKNTRGVGNKNWVMRDIANTLIAIPPSNEQHRIVAKLDEYFILINQI